MTYYATRSAEHCLQLTGSFDALAVESLRQDFDQLILEGSDIALDFNQVTFIDSSGVGAIVFLFKRLRALERSLRIVHAAGQPLQLLRYLRIDRTIEVTANPV